MQRRTSSAFASAFSARARWEHSIASVSTLMGKRSTPSDGMGGDSTRGASRRAGRLQLQPQDALADTNKSTYKKLVGINSSLETELRQKTKRITELETSTAFDERLVVENERLAQENERLRAENQRLYRTR